MSFLMYVNYTYNNYIYVAKQRLFSVLINIQIQIGQKLHIYAMHTHHIYIYIYIITVAVLLFAHDFIYTHFRHKLDESDNVHTFSTQIR